MGNKPGRNESCPCGSGKKCHGASPSAPGPTPTHREQRDLPPPNASAGNPIAGPVEIYCALMEDAKRRMALIRSIANGSLTLGTETFNYECASLQLRKVLESIAFGSLCANTVAYAQVHANFEKHHRAKDLLRALVTPPVMSQIWAEWAPDYWRRQP